ncbi:hypothetical protein E1B28_011628 [Marasmius oreades]|uniref:Chromo domain-containing protein n=1 Tax=Marasmius oreades TaxID=181124 RepID=A0A9P7RVK2_9AGAR|nr:uncharacterized protein E1B28_011628 [Marasmius oreades]KAG7090006.1 hypothetical protein E1B28_011628 [Marasmius oreades]
MLDEDATHAELWDFIDTIIDVVKSVGVQLEKDYTQMVLIDDENAQLRAAVFEKGKKKKMVYNWGHARHLTNAECLIQLAKEEWRHKAKDLYKEVRKAHQTLQKRMQLKDKQEQDKEKKRLAEGKKLEWEQSKAAKQLEKEKSKQEKQAEKEKKQQEKQAKPKRGQNRGQRVQTGEQFDFPDSSSENSATQSSSLAPPPRPKPQPLPRPAANTVPEDSELESSDSENEYELEDMAIVDIMVEQDEEEGVDDDVKPEIHVLEIIKHCCKAGILEFWVSWADGDKTWELLNNVEDLEALDAYLKTKKISDLTNL